jgi:RNA polymerase sigma-70 factor (ECF subfamily)
MPGISQPAVDLEVSGLIHAAKGGDQEAFAQIMIHYQRPVWKMAFYTLGRAEDADDVVQDVFLRVHKYIGGFDCSKRFAPWLYGITDRVCKDHFRKRNQDQTFAGEGNVDLRGEPPSQEEDMIAAEQRRIFAEALKSLPTRQRQAIILRGIEGLSSTDAAVVLGTDPATIRQQAGKALVKLTKFVKGHFGRSLVAGQR